MSGHNKWSQIKHRKAASDAKKSQLFSKLARLISLEAKKAKGDSNAPGLKAVIEKARKANMPNENIERAIKKATEVSENLESIIYEAYGPGGVALIIETLTDNKNRTAQEIKHILSLNNANLTGVGSATWAFKKEGAEWVPTVKVSLNDPELHALDKLVSDLEDLNDVSNVYTNAE